MSKQDTIEINVPALIMDGTPDGVGDVFSPDTVVVVNNDLLITTSVDYYKKESVIGRGKLEKNGDTFYVKATIPTHKLSPELASLLVPSVFGIMDKREGKNVIKCTIQGVALTGGPNADKRIRPIGESQPIVVKKGS